MNCWHFIEGITENGQSVPLDPSRDIYEIHKAVERIGGVLLLIIDPIVSAVAAISSELRRMGRGAMSSSKQLSLDRPFFRPPVLSRAKKSPFQINQISK